MQTRLLFDASPKAAMPLSVGDHRKTSHPGRAVGLNHTRPREARTKKMNGQTEALHRQIGAKRDFSKQLKYDPAFCDQLVDYFESCSVTTVGERITQVLEPDEPGGRKAKGSLKREVRAICGQLPTFQRFARMIGCASSLLFYWERRHPEWREACERARDVQRNWIFQAGLSDTVEPAALIFVATNVLRFGLRREQSLIVEPQEPMEPDSQLARIPMEDLERAQGLANAIAAGFTPEERSRIDELLAARSERTRNGGATAVSADDGNN
jgi:hypothetical protein